MVPHRSQAAAMPSRPLAPHRSLLLSRLSCHRDAIFLLVSELGDYEAGLRYCAQHSASNPAGDAAAPAPSAAAAATTATSPAAELLTTNLYLILLEALVHPPAGGAPHTMVPAAEALLMSHASQLDLGEAIRLLPGSLPVDQLQRGLDALLNEAQERRRSSQMGMHLQKAVSMQTRSRLLELRARRLLISDETECARCRRRIGTAAFTCTPSGEIFHMSCYESTR